MLLLASAALFAVSAGCLAWYVLHLRELRSLVSHRMSVLPQNLSFPYNFNPASEKEVATEDVVTLEDSYANKLTRKLYLAGIRDRKKLPLFQTLMRLSYVAPVVVLVVGIFVGGLKPALLLRTALIAFQFFFVGHMIIHGRRKKLERTITKTLPQVLDLLIVSLEAGLNFTAALPRVLDEMDPANPLIKEFRMIHHEYLGGLSFAQACDRMSRRCDYADLSIIMSAIIESEQTGASLANVLRIHSHELRDKYRQRLRERAHKLPIKLLFPMMLIFITIFTIALGPSVFRMKQHIGDFQTPGSPKIPVTLLKKQA